MQNNESISGTASVLWQVEEDQSTGSASARRGMAYAPTRKREHDVNKKLTILLADDHELFRDGMNHVLQQLANEVKVLGAENFSYMLQLADQHPEIGLVLMDLGMPGSEGVGSVRTFCLKHPEMPLVVVSGSEQRADIERTMEYGAMGFISKQTSGRVMISALRMVLEGGVYVPPQLLQQVSMGLDQDGGAPDKRTRRTGQCGLTPRQIDVLKLLARGLTNREIAEVLDLAEGTVKIHVAGIFLVLRVNSRMDAVLAGQRLGVLPHAAATAAAARAADAQMDDNPSGGA
jgi:DNA-binding NarL/FixJ family response regulator